MMVGPSTVTVSEGSTGGPCTGVLFRVVAPPAVRMKACRALLFGARRSLRNLHSVRNPNLQSDAALNDSNPFANGPIQLVPRNMLKNMAGIDQVEGGVWKRKALR